MFREIKPSFDCTCKNNLNKINAKNVIFIATNKLYIAKAPVASEVLCGVM